MNAATVASPWRQGASAASRAARLLDLRTHTEVVARAHRDAVADQVREPEDEADPRAQRGALRSGQDRHRGDDAVERAVDHVAQVVPEAAAGAAHAGLRSELAQLQGGHRNQGEQERASPASRSGRSWMRNSLAAAGIWWMPIWIERRHDDDRDETQVGEDAHLPEQLVGLRAAKARNSSLKTSVSNASSRASPRSAVAQAPRRTRPA